MILLCVRTADVTAFCSAVSKQLKTSTFRFSAKEKIHGNSRVTLIVDMK